MTDNLCGTMSVLKTARLRSNCLRSTFGFRSAREAFQHLLSAYRIAAGDAVLLPSFIGWSQREGSGVYDPVANVGAEPIFYRIDENLSIDADDVKDKLLKRKPRLMVLIHYFGYPDPNAAYLAAFARQNGVCVLEDEAHAMLSDLVGGVCGRSGDAVIFSLHKMLPFSEGGILLLNKSFSEVVRTQIAASDLSSDMPPFWEYDLHRIASVRRRNAEQLIGAMAELEGYVKLLFPSLPPGVVPQTLPVITLRKNRDELYFEMNDAGFGVVSLYHTLIAQIDAQEFPESHALASRILNLPVHQDVEPEQLTAMIAKLRELA